MRKYLLLSVVGISILSSPALLASDQDFEAARQVSLREEEDREMSRILHQIALNEKAEADAKAAQVIADAYAKEDRELAEIMHQISLSERKQPSSNFVEKDSDLEAALRLSDATYANEKNSEVVKTANTPKELKKHLENFDATRNALNLSTPAYRQPLTRKQEESDLLAALGRSVETVKKEAQNGKKVVSGSLKDKINHFNNQ